MDLFNKFGLELGDFVAPVFVATVAAVFAAFMFNFVRDMAVFIKLKLSGFHEREELILNGNRVVISKIGFGAVTFLKMNGDGVVEKWITVENSRMGLQSIERISLRIKRMENAYEAYWENEQEKARRANAGPYEDRK